jgi:hypothetical protein
MTIMTNAFTYWRALAAASLVLIAAYAYSVVADDAAQKAKPPSPDFSGKIVVVIIDQSSAVERRENTEVLEDAAMSQIGGRYFIVGKAYTPAEVSTNWRSGSQVGVSWEKVHMYYAYTPEQFKNYAKRWSDATDDK